MSSAALAAWNSLGNLLGSCGFSGLSLPTALAAGNLLGKLSSLGNCAASPLGNSAANAALELARELSRELDLGKCPREIVLGTSAVHTAREFARELYLVAALRLMPPGNLLDALAVLAVFASGSIVPAFDFFGAAFMRAAMASFSGLSAF